MAYEPKPGQFSLFKNDRKEKDTHPDYRGDGVTIDGKPAWISAWLKEGSKGKFFSISLQLKNPERDSPRDQGADFRGGGSGGVAERQDRGIRESFPADLDDQIPFIERGER